MNKSGILPLLAVGVIFIGLTLAVFFLLEIEQIAISFWALGFLLLSEVVFIGGLIILRVSDSPSNGVFLKAGVTSSLILYFIATLITVLISGIFTERVNTFILIQIGIISFFLVAIIMLALFSKNIANRNAIDAEKVGSKEVKRGGF